MSTVEEIKAAAASLKPEEQFELYKWLTESKMLRQRQLEALQKDIAIGLDQMEQGQYRVYDEHSLNSLADEIKSKGRKRLAEQKRDGRP